MHSKLDLHFNLISSFIHVENIDIKTGEIYWNKVMLRRTIVQVLADGDALWHKCDELEVDTETEILAGVIGCMRC